jgi:hypothetical protein
MEDAGDIFDPTKLFSLIVQIVQPLIEVDLTNPWHLMGMLIIAVFLYLLAHAVREYLRERVVVSLKDRLGNQIIRSKARERLFTFMERVSSSDGRWDSDEGNTLYEEIKRFVDERCSDGYLAEYAILIEGHFLVKVGPRLIGRNIDRIGILRGLANKGGTRHGAAAAATYQLARIRLAQGSQEPYPSDQYHYFKAAKDLFSGIREECKLAYPVLLPGIRSESPEEKLIRNDTPIADPLVKVVPVPHRYVIDTLAALAGVNLALAEQCPGQASQYLEEACLLLQEAKYLSTHAVALSGLGSPHLSLNIRVSELMVDTYRISQFDIYERKNPAIRRLYKLIGEIQEQAKHLPGVKVQEWTGSCWAAIACLADSDEEHELSLRRLYECIAEVRQRRPFLTDWLTIDPIYRLAHTTPDEKDQFWRFIKAIHSPRAYES